MSEDEEMPESEDIVSDFENSPEGELKQSTQEENLNEDDFDYQQGFNYPEQQYKDSITKFYRHVISLLKPKQVVRVGNFSFSEKKNAKLCLDMAFYNHEEGADLIERFWRDRAVNVASVSMGYKGFIVTNIMTQRRIVQRQSDKASPKVSGWSNPNQNKGG